MKGVLQRATCALALVTATCAPRSVEPSAGPAGVVSDAVPEPSGARVPDRHATHGAAAAAAWAANPADVKFMQDMIGHHAQALVMTAMAPTRGASGQILQLAEKIDISQRDEIRMMQDWLTDRGQPLPDEHHAHTMHMPGMLTAEQLAQLDAARGAQFDRLFLTFMIQHHEGALTMVDVLFASPGAGQDPDIFRFATDVATDQLDEIDVMIHMLNTLANRGDEPR